jgi:hypothetical protein
MIRRVTAVDQAEADRKFGLLGVRHNERRNRIEIASVVGRGQDIVKRLESRRTIDAEIDLEVWAPSGIEVRALGQDALVTAEGFRKGIEIRTRRGPAEIRNTSGGPFQVTCAECAASLTRVKGNARITAQDQGVRVENSLIRELFIETTRGGVDILGVKGRALIRTSGGNISVKGFEGWMEFRSTTGNVAIEELRGGASGETESGGIKVRATDWTADKAFLASRDGSIDAGFPSSLAAAVDFRSETGKTESDFDIRPRTESKQPVRLGPGHLRGIIGPSGGKSVLSAGAELRVSTQSGSIRVIRTGAVL